MGSDRRGNGICGSDVLAVVIKCLHVRRPTDHDVHQHFEIQSILVLDVPRVHVVLVAHPGSVHRREAVSFGRTTSRSRSTGIVPLSALICLSGASSRWVKAREVMHTVLCSYQARVGANSVVIKRW